MYLLFVLILLLYAARFERFYKGKPRDDHFLEKVSTMADLRLKTAIIEKGHCLVDLEIKKHSFSPTKNLCLQRIIYNRVRIYTYNSSLQ